MQAIRRNSAEKYGKLGETPVWNGFKLHTKNDGCSWHEGWHLDMLMKWNQSSDLNQQNGMTIIMTKDGFKVCRTSLLIKVTLYVDIEYIHTQIIISSIFCFRQ